MRKRLKDVFQVVIFSSFEMFDKESLRTTAIEIPKSKTEAREIKEAKNKYTPNFSLPKFPRMIEIEKKLATRRYT